MNISRNITNKIRFVLDEFTPPILRDSKLFMYLPMYLALKKDTKLHLEFKKKAYQFNDEEFTAAYKQLDDSSQRETDLNTKSIQAIKKLCVGKTVLEAGCGKGYLARILEKKHNVTGLDIVIPEHKKKNATLRYIKGNVEKLPFKDSSFDTVVSTHTLEHVIHLDTAISELRRVTKKRLIIVVPKQRPYKYTFDLHLNFFPYTYTLIAAMGNKERATCQEIDGDLLYVEEIQPLQ